MQLHASIVLIAKVNYQKFLKILGMNLIKIKYLINTNLMKNKTIIIIIMN